MGRPTRLNLFFLFFSFFQPVPCSFRHKVTKWALLAWFSAQTVLSFLTCFNLKVKEGQKLHFTAVLQLTEAAKEWQEVDRNREQGVTGTKGPKQEPNTDCHGYTWKSFLLFLQALLLWTCVNTLLHLIRRGHIENSQLRPAAEKIC